MSTAVPQRRRRPWWLRRLLPAVLALVLLAELALHVLVVPRLTRAAQQALPAASVQAKACRRPVAVGLLLGRLDCIRLEATDLAVPAGGRELRVSTLQATARGVDASGGRVVVGSLDGEANISWQELTRVSGATFEAGPQGLVKATAQVPLLGERLPVALTGRPELDVDSQQLRLVEPSATIDGVPVPEGLLSGLLGAVSSRYPLPAVQGVRWTAVEAGPDGVRLDFEAHDVELQQR